MAEPAERTAADDLARELAGRWAPIMLERTWRERLDLLNLMHEQLLDDLKDLKFYAEVSPLLIQYLIERLGVTPVSSVDQAQIYANSASEAHRAAAGHWLMHFRSA